MSSYAAPGRGLRYFLPQTQQLVIDKFDGGLNSRDAPSELADNETPNCMNVTLDERGGVVGRLGRTKKNAGGALPGTPSNVYYWPSKQITIFQVGATIYRTDNEFGSWSSVATLTSSDRCAFTDFNGKLVAAHKIDGVFTYDGTTWALATASVKGACISSWQNKVQVAGDPQNPTRVWWCNAGNASLWTIATDFVDIREKDDAPITAIGLGQGMDVAGRPGLLVYKEESAYRINSSTTGAYTTIDPSAGAASPLAVTSLLGVTCAIGKRGIFTTDDSGVNELKLVSGKVSPIFDPSQINFAQQDLFCAGVYRDRVVFSFPWGGAQLSNNRALEYHPILGWIVPHSFGASAFTTYAKQAQKLYAASPNSSNVYEQFKGGSDDGVAIVARYQTRWVVPTLGMLNSFTRCRLFGRGAFNLYTKLDYTLGQGELNSVSILGTAFTWNDPAAVWNDAAMVWGPSLYEDWQDFYQLGFARALAFNLSHTGTTSTTGPPLLDDGFAPEVGAFACYSLTVDYTRCGYA